MYAYTPLCVYICMCVYAYIYVYLCLFPHLGPELNNPNKLIEVRKVTYRFRARRQCGPG